MSWNSLQPTRLFCSRSHTVILIALILTIGLGSSGLSQESTAPVPLTNPPTTNNGPAANNPSSTNPDSDASNPPPNSNDFTQGFSSDFGNTFSGFSSSPTMMGDHLGIVATAASINNPQIFQFTSPGIILNGASPGSTDAQLGFFSPGNISGTPDIFTDGHGVDTVGHSDGADQFNILEPIGPGSPGTSPGAPYSYDGGTAVYTPSGSGTVPQSGTFLDGDQWFIHYSFSGPIYSGGDVHPLLVGPDVATRRVKISENFSPEVRNRTFVNYNFFNDAFNGLGDISRFVLGCEQIVYQDFISLELRLPMAGTFSSIQSLPGSNNRGAEIGDATAIAKCVMLRTNKSTWSAGMGVSVPTADDSKLFMDDREVLRIVNQSVHVSPFTGLLYRLNQRNLLQAYLQLDIDTNGNPVYGDLEAGRFSSLPLMGRISDAALMHLDVAWNKLLYESQRGFVSSILGNAELHYTTTLQDTEIVRGNRISVGGLTRRSDVLNATVGSHLVLHKNLVVSPAMSVPLRNGLDQQFDYEALLQVNYLW